MPRLVHRLLRPLGRYHPRRLWATFRWLVAVSSALRERRREPRLTVAVDVLSLWEPLTGVGWYVHQLLSHLAERDDVRLRLYGATLVPTPDAPQPVIDLPEGPAIEVVAYPVPPDMTLSHEWAIPKLRALEDRLIALERNDVLFAPNYVLPPRFERARGPLVATVLDLTLEIVPHTMREETAAMLSESLAATASRADRLITISETVRGEMIEHGIGRPERIDAIHLGPGQVAAARPGVLPDGLPRCFALFLGTIEPRKNLGCLLDAWGELRSRGSDPPVLVVCGRFGWKADHDRERLERGEAEGWVKYLGYVDSETAAALLAAATVLVFPSVYEGFGLPVVEAMQLGTPVIASDIPVLREVGADAVRYAPPSESSAWADQLQALFGDGELRRELSVRGRARATEFSWATTATRTLAVLRSAAEEAR